MSCSQPDEWCGGKLWTLDRLASHLITFSATKTYVLGLHDPFFHLADSMWLQVYDSFLTHAKQSLLDFYGPDPRTSDSFARIVSTGHAERLQHILNQKNGRIICGGGACPSDKYIEPTIIAGMQFCLIIVMENDFSRHGRCHGGQPCDAGGAFRTNIACAQSEKQRRGLTHSIVAYLGLWTRNDSGNWYHALARQAFGSLPLWQRQSYLRSVRVARLYSFKTDRGNYFAVILGLWVASRPVVCASMTHWCMWWVTCLLEE